MTESHIWVGDMGYLHTSMCELIGTLSFFRQEGPDAVVTEAMANRVDELMGIVKAHRKTERSPPAGLGYRNTDATHKAAAVAHQLFLLNGPMMKFWTRRILSFTTDFGVEAGLGKVKYRLDLLCPHAVKLQFEADDAGDEMMVDVPMDDDNDNPLEFDLTT
eukprot:9385869-Pyramimonas_sp.AAC.1